MDPILITITGLSLAVAFILGVLVVRMRREEQRRSDARVALLEQLATATAYASTPATVHPPPELFHEHQAAAAWPRRFAIAAGLMAMLAVGLVGWAALRPIEPATSATTATSLKKKDQPLELLALQHAQHPSELVITGIVQNPRDAVSRSGIQATVQLFGTGGEALAGGRAPLDFTTLSPGDESPFVIRVPVSRPVARYRVGFRGENDRVLGHVDRRSPETLARRQAP